MRELEAAAHGDLGSLVDLFSGVEVRALTRAMSLAADIQREADNISQVIGAVRDALQQRGTSSKEEWNRAKELSGNLLDYARDQIEEVVAQLRREVGPQLAESEFFADSESANSRRSGYYRFQVLEAAKRHDYFANLRDHHAWTRLVLRAGTQAEILVSFHTLGRDFRGVVVGSLVFFKREETEGHQAQVTDLTPLTDEVFQVNYLEQGSLVEERFRKWFRDGLIRGLDRWYRGL